MSSKMWEVDPETRSKLLAIQKTNGNDRCCDCGAPSPQWASPKFGTFICLNCAGIHRGLGVHISFVRSITMDAFKHAETQRMELGGNDPWKQFFDSHALTIAEGKTFEECTIKERYEGEVGEEWKARLTAKVEGKEYVPGEKKPDMLSRSNTPSTTKKQASTSSRSDSPTTKPDVISGRKERNEAFFARLGEENSSRPEHLPPSQGGKYTGFGGGMPTTSRTSQQNGGIPSLNEFQSDPVGALTRGFGWFTSTVGKGAKTVTETYIQPTAKSIAESELAAQARMAAADLSRNLQTSARGAAEHFNRFVEGPSDDRRTANRRFEPERKDFWDEFSSIGEQRRATGAVSTSRGAGSSGAIGTAALKKETPFSSSVSASAPGAASSTSISKDKDEWDDNW
ncbi:hypothetical protein VTO42DRAFT_7502 [Malbranchea cinnamomea]